MRKHGRHESPGRVLRPRWIYPTAILLGGLLVGSATVLTTSQWLMPATSASSSLDFAACATPVTVDVAASPRIYGIVSMAASKAGKSSCTSVKVRSEEAAVTANALIAGVGPDLWIPDSTMWATDVNGQGRGEVTQGPSLATSPLVVAVPGRFPMTKASWKQLVDGDLPMQIADPLSNTSGRLAVVAARTALGGDKAITGALGARLVNLSRTAATSDDQLLERLVTAPQDAMAFPVEEAALMAFELAHPNASVHTLVPTDGTSRFDYPLLTHSDATPAVSQAATALTTVLFSPEMREQVRQAGLRNSITEVVPNAGGTTSVAPAYITLPSASETEAILREWTSVQTDARMLVVMDTSGSMAYPAGDTTRMRLAREAGILALADVPDTSQMGLWMFASRLGGNTVDYRKLVPIRELSAPVGSSTQRAAMSKGFATAARSVRGDTGLYDTVAAAYAELQRTYDPSKVNTLVVITDGRNDDPDGGLSLSALVSRLKSADHSRPISVAMVGITKDADVSALRRIADAAGGRLYQADQPSKIQAVLVDALLSRRA